MKKKILVVSSSLCTGGLEKCLVNFCNNFDSERYEVDLYLFNEGRALQDTLNDNINVLPDSPYYADVYNKSLVSSIITLLKKKQLSLVIYKLGRFIRTRLHKDLNTVNDWENMKKTMLKNPKHYDVAIGFEEGSSGYYVSECADADVKLCWVHTDIKMISTCKEMDRRTFKNVKYVCTVSQNSVNSLCDYYPEFKEKFRCYTLPTMLDYAQIDLKAIEPCEMSNEHINILSVGRLVELKGFHLCVRPLKKLISEGYKLKWYIAGDGDYRETVENLIKTENVEDDFILLGNCDNPYKYIKNADICVQPSSYEGFSVAVWEEKYLKKPVVATTIPSNFEILTDDVNGVLIERNEDAIYEALKELLDNPQKCESMANASANGFEESMNVMAEIEKTFQ